MSLTTADGVDSDISNDWTKLKKRIERKFGFKPEYIRVKTSEGNGVLHIVYRGKYIPQRWLSSQWSDIHNSTIVDIRWIRSSKQIAGYLTQYVSSQYGFERFSTSWNWIKRGSGKDYKIIKEGCKDLDYVCYSDEYNAVYFKIDFNLLMRTWRWYIFNTVFPGLVPSSDWLSDNGKFNDIEECDNDVFCCRFNVFSHCNNPRSQSNLDGFI